MFPGESKFVLPALDILYDTYQWNSSGIDLVFYF